MIKLRILSVLCALAFVVLSSTVNASLIVPDGLNPGDKYHVIFVSSTIRDATSVDITDYDAHVQAAADAAGIGETIIWRAVGSTSTIDAKDHLLPLFPTSTTVPIYNQNGDLVATSLAQLWSGLTSAVRYDEYGNDLAGLNVWTGTAPPGVAGSTTALGSSGVIIGSTISTSTSWYNSGTTSNVRNLSLYGLSSELTVANAPIPAAVWLFGSGLLGLIGITRRKKAS